MPVDSESGKKAAATNKKNDPDYYSKIGAVGGSKSKTGGFYHMMKTDPERLKKISLMAVNARFKNKEK